MGWNEGWTIMEQTVIGAYDLDKLDKPLLTVLLEPYRDTDIDSGGKRGTLTKDGKGVEQVVIETWGLAMPEPPDAPAPDYRNWRQFTQAEKDADDQWDAHGEAIGDLFNEVTRAHGWR